MAGAPSDWTINVCTAEELVDRYSSRLPKFLLVEEGFYVKDRPDLLVSSGSVLRCHGVEVMQCVVARKEPCSGQPEPSVMIPMSYKGHGMVLPLMKRCEFVWELCNLAPQPRYIMPTRQCGSDQERREAPVKQFEILEVCGRMNTGQSTLMCRRTQLDRQPVVVLQAGFKGDFDILPDTAAPKCYMQDAFKEHQHRCPIRFNFIREDEDRDKLFGDYVLKSIEDVQILVVSVHVTDTLDSPPPSPMLFLPVRTDSHDAKFKLSKEKHSDQQRADWERIWQKIVDIVENKFVDLGWVQAVELTRPTKPQHYEPLYYNLPHNPAYYQNDTKGPSDDLPEDGSVGQDPIISSASVGVREADDSVEQYIPMNFVRRASGSRAALRHDFAEVEIPNRLVGLSVEDLVEKLQECGLHHVAEVCEREKVDGNLFLDLEEKDFSESPFQLNRLDIRKVRKIKTEGWRPLSRKSSTSSH